MRAVPVGRAGRHAFEEGEHATHLRHRVERGDEVHLGRAGVREHHVDAGRDEAANQRLAADHRALRLARARSRVEHHPGIEDAVGIERRLDPAP